MKWHEFTESAFQSLTNRSTIRPLEAGVAFQQLAGVVAARADQLRAAKLLIESGADVDNKGCGPPYGPLRDAIFSDNPQMVELLLRHGANVDAAVDGCSSLYFAYQMENSEIVQILLRYGADPELECRGQKVPDEFLRSLTVKVEKLR